MTETASSSREWSDFLRYENEGSYLNALSALKKIEAHSASGDSILQVSDAQRQREAIYTEVSQKARMALDRAAKQLLSAKTSEEVEAIDHGLSGYQEVLRDRSGDFSDLLLRLAKVRQVAATWRLVVIAQTQNDPAMMDRFLNELPKANSGPDPVIPGTAIDEKRKVAATQQAAASHPSPSVVPADNAWLTALPGRISRISKGSDAAILVNELRERARNPTASESGLREDLYQLQSDLSSLVQFAAACEHARFNFGMVAGADAINRHRWQQQTAEVRARLARQSLAAQIGPRAP
jgi:hypothetical protein